MSTRAFPIALLVSSALLQAQNPCGPPTHLATQGSFSSTHYYSAPGQNNGATPPIPQNLPAGYRGFLTLADLTANAELTVSQIDFKLIDDGSIRYTWGPMPGQAGGPGLVGHTAAVNVYTTPDSWVGKETTPPGPGSPWTLGATGTLTVMPHSQHSPAVLTVPFTVPVGTLGFAVEVGPVTEVVPAITYLPPPYAMHPALLVSPSAPGAPLTAADQFLSITNEDITNQAFVTGPIPVPKSAIFDLHYSVASDAAYFTHYGSGCYDRPEAFYEVFQPATPTQFDLSNSAFRMMPSGPSYTVTASSSAIVAPASSPLNNGGGTPLRDDERTPPLPLGFTFSYQGGTTTKIVVTSNGNIFLDPANSGGQTATFEVFGVAGFLRGQPQLAPLWSDLDPSAGGSVHLDVDLGASVPVAYVTWLAVPEWNVPGSSNTVQVALFADGNVELRYGACAIVRVPALVGFNPGWSAHDPGATDISASLPFTTGDGAVPPVLDMDARPILGSTPNLVVGDMPADAAGFMMIGLPFNGFDLGFLGMTGCVQRVLPLSLKSLHAVGPTATLPMQIPNSRWLLGARLYAQSLVESAGSNHAGRTISNPLCIRLGR